MDQAPPQPSQASSHFQIEPVSGATLFDQETRRRDTLARRGRCLTGCRELDDQVLLGGFERGCVVGVSAEEEDVGLLVSMTIPGAVSIGTWFANQTRPDRAADRGEAVRRQPWDWTRPGTAGYGHHDALCRRAAADFAGHVQGTACGAGPRTWKGE